MSGERDPLKLVALRGKRCQKSPEEFAACLTGTWREEHLLNLEAELGLYDAAQERIAVYEPRLLEEIRALQPEERREEAVPTHPNPAREMAMRGRGDQPTHGAWQAFLAGGFRYSAQASDPDLLHASLRLGIRGNCGGGVRGGASAASVSPLSEPRPSRSDTKSSSKPPLPPEEELGFTTDHISRELPVANTSMFQASDQCVNVSSSAM